MNKYQLITQYSPWLTIVCLLVAAAYTTVLYLGPHTWSKQVNYMLSGLRFTVVFCLSFLLIGPFLKHFKNYFENPSIVIAVDNSQSIGLAADSGSLKDLKQTIAALKTRLEQIEAEVEIRVLDQSAPVQDASTIAFNAANTNLSKMLTEVTSDYANRNLTGVVLLSDGVFNSGMSPNYLQYPFTLHTVGLGDTVPKQDIAIKSLLYNKVAYTGNRFSIMAELHHEGFDGQSISIQLKQQKKIIAQKLVTLTPRQRMQQVEFTLASETKGLQHYQIETKVLDNEYIAQNNSAHAYVEIIEGKEKILIVAAAPHPDIKALRSALEKKENYEIQVYIPSLQEYKDDKYDLVILHQVPDFYNSASALMQRFLSAGTSILFITGSQTNFAQFNTLNQVMKLISKSSQFDNVTPSINPAFEKFKFDAADTDMINSYPPLSVPFGNYTLGAGGEVILYQQLGQVVTPKPLLSLAVNGTRKIGVLNGAGIWQWQLHEFNQTQDTKVFDKLVANLVQFLSSKEDKRKFRVYPINQEFLNEEPVSFQAEVYNDIYEKVYGQKISLSVTNEAGEKNEYSFVNQENFSRFEISGLKQGVYKYLARSTMDSKPVTSQGEFAVRNVNLEATNMTADHQLLRTLSAQTGGNFLPLQSVNNLPELFTKEKLQKVIHSDEEFEEFINLPIIFFLLLGLLSLEWFIRKYHGAY